MSDTDTIIGQSSEISKSEYMQESSERSSNHSHVENSSNLENNQNTSFYIMPLNEFEVLKNPLDTIEHLYSSPSSAFEFYGINDLKENAPFTYFNLSSLEEIIIKATTIQCFRYGLYLTVIKMLIFPHFVFFDICGFSAILRVDTSRISSYTCVIFMMILLRIVVCITIIVLYTVPLAIGIGIWLIAGVIVEIPQFLLIMVAYSRVKYYTDEQLEIIKYESFER